MADVQELSISYYDGLLVFEQLVADGRSLGESEQHQRAADSWAQARQVLVDVRTVVDDIATGHGQVDAAVLDEPDLEDADEPLDLINLQHRRELDAALQYVSGSERTHLALLQLDEGSALYEKEDYEAARTEWDAGRTHLEGAATAFEAVVDNNHARQAFRDDSSAMVDYVETLVEAFDTFVAGATAAAAGDVREGNELVGEGFALLGE